MITSRKKHERQQLEKNKIKQQKETSIRLKIPKNVAEKAEKRLYKLKEAEPE